MVIDTKLMTAEVFAELGPEEANSELIRGQSIRVTPPGFEHAEIVASLTTVLKTHVKNNKLGRVGSEGGFRIERSPDTVLAPDVAYIGNDRISRSTTLRTGYPDVAPELVFEVISPSDYAEPVDRKISIYLLQGVQMVVAVWPRDRKLTVMRSHQAPLALFEGDVLDLSDVIAGLIVSVSEIFE